LPCGAVCDPCDPMDPACPPPMTEWACDPQGVCVPAMGMTCPPQFDPCAMKACGEPCLLCPPNDPNCVEPPEPNACDEMGQCVPGMFTCTAQGDAGAADGGMAGP
jgi:hypothetical protein